MKPSFVTKPAFYAVGMAYHGANQAGEISKLWEDFIPRASEIKEGFAGALGLCLPAEEDGSINYLASIGVADPPAVPPGMQVWQVPEQLYAVFPCKLSTIRQVCQAAFGDWLPQSGYDFAGGAFFEYYGVDFNPGRGKDDLHVYIPVRKNADKEKFFNSR
jgi:predicted transcriptional regulator YdeE